MQTNSTRRVATLWGVSGILPDYATRPWAGYTMLLISNVVVSQAFMSNMMGQQRKAVCSLIKV